MVDVTTYILARGYTNGAIAQHGDDGTTVKEIEVETISGQLPAEDLEALLKSSAAVVKLEGRIYRLARIEGNNYKYLNSATNGSGQVINMIELDIDKTTGEFSTKQILIEGSAVGELEDLLRAHIEDNNVHITATERNY